MKTKNTAAEKAAAARAHEIQEMLHKLHAIYQYAQHTGEWERWHEITAFLDDIYWLMNRARQKAENAHDPDTRH